MKIRTAKYIFKDGVINTYRNKLMSLASISIIAASLFIFGIFYLFVINLNNNVSFLKQQPEMQIFCKVELSDNEVKSVEDVIKSNDKVGTYKLITRGETFKNYKELLKDDKQLLDDFDESIAPVSFNLKLKNVNDSEYVSKQFEGLSGVDKVTYPQKTIELITKVTNWAQIISASLIIILLLISMFIISNTIKLTVFARRKEIGIMKYIGATDWFIRWPFIIEGIIIGCIGAVISFGISCYIYDIIAVKFNKDLLDSSVNLIKLINITEVWRKIALFYFLIGAFVGSVGSFVSIRKYLHV
jgi:cell division transport system permease protein